MPDLLPPWTLLAPFLAAAIALNLTPGADMTYVLARSLGQGREAGLISALGIAAGSAIHTILAAVGLSAVLMHSEAAFTAVKLGGAAYLLWLAFKALRDGGPAAAAMNERPPAPLGRIFLEATLTNLLNPKVALFVLAFLPQFVAPEQGHVALQILLLGTIFNTSSTVVNGSVALSMSAARSFVLGSSRMRRALAWFSAAVFAGLAARLALAERG
jgi:threonine/homoserine/homoserine lactone efflux protein